jgi:DNA mismatch endonuclease Vsr
MKTPSFKGLKAASIGSSLSKQRNQPTDTSHERLLRSMLWRQGLRFRKNVRDVAGTPDIVFAKHKLAVFCDADFWQRRKWDGPLSKVDAKSECTVLDRQNRSESGSRPSNKKSANEEWVNSRETMGNGHQESTRSSCRDDSCNRCPPKQPKKLNVEAASLRLVAV